MDSLLTAFFMAWGMFCAIPCPLRRWDETLRGWMLACFPLIGLRTGGIWSAAAALLRLFACPLLPEAAILTALPFLLTGFIHLDGYMDCCDAILSRREREERLRILKDPHVGSFAVIGFGLLLLLEFAAVHEAVARESNLWLLTAISCAARCPSSLAILTAPSLPGSGYANVRNPSPRRAVTGSFAVAGSTAVTGIILACAVALPLFSLRVPQGACPALASSGAALSIVWAARQLGGVNGDISGFGVTIGELCGVAALAALA